MTFIRVSGHGVLGVWAAMMTGFVFSASALAQSQAVPAAGAPSGNGVVRAVPAATAQRAHRLRCCVYADPGW